MLQLDEVGRILDPSFDANASIRRNVAALMTRRMGKDLIQTNAYRALLEMKDFTTGLPSRINRIMDAATNSELEVKVKATDAKMVMDGMAKFANRITMGIVLAGLIVGASILARVPSGFQLFGYPGLAILCFSAAAAGSFWLVISIFVSDYESAKNTPADLRLQPHLRIGYGHNTPYPISMLSCTMRSYKNQYLSTSLS